MKKLLALLLAVIMILSFAACGENDDDDDDDRDDKVTETTKPEADSGKESSGQKDDDAQKENDDIKDNDDQDTESGKEETVPGTEVEPTQEEEIEINEGQISVPGSPYTTFDRMNVTVVNEDNIKVTIGEPEMYISLMSVPVKVENFSDEKISVSATNVAVNGLHTGNALYTVHADTNSEATGSFSISIDDSEAFTRLSLDLTVEKEDYKSTHYLIDIYPKGIDAYKDPTPSIDGWDVALDQDDVCVAFSNYNYDKEKFFADHVMINNSMEPRAFTVNLCAINDYAVQDIERIILLPDTCYIDTFYTEQHVPMYEMGMNEISSVNFRVVMGPDFWDNLADNTVTVYPSGTPNDEAFKYSYDQDDIVLADTDAFKISLVKCVDDEYNTTDVLFVMENFTGKTIKLSGKEIIVNGKPIANEYIFASATDGKNTYAVFTLYGNIKEQNNIDKITSFEMKLVAEDENTSVIFEDTVTCELG